MLYLHTHSPPVAHRDLKSPNLLVDSQWHLKVCSWPWRRTSCRTSSTRSCMLAC